LKQEKLRGDFYEEMVNVAEEKFKISIRKMPVPVNKSVIKDKA